MSQYHTTGPGPRSPWRPRPMRGLARGWCALALAAFSLCDVGHASLTFIQLQQDGVDGVDGLDAAIEVAINPDGTSLYVMAFFDSGAVFQRNTTTGFLTFVERSPVGGSGGVAVSPDGQNVYIASDEGSSVSVFRRDPVTARLTFVEAKQDGVDGVDGLYGAEAVAVSPDGSSVYVGGAGEDALAAFQREPMSGTLTFIGVQREGVGGVDGLDLVQAVTVSPDGRNVYAASFNDNAVAVFQRNTATGDLSFLEVHRDGVGGVDGLFGAISVAVSPDGNHVYAAGLGDSAIAVFARDPMTGHLTFIEQQRNGVGGVDGILGISAVAVSPDGTSVYGAGYGDDGLAVFRRDGVTGHLTFIEAQFDGLRGVRGLVATSSIAVSNDGNNVYTTGRGSHAVAAFRRLRVECASSPVMTCHFPTASKTGLFQLKVGSGNARVSWRWVKGTATAVGDFGDPVNTFNDIVLCVYDQSGNAQPVMHAAAPAEGSCDTRPCWKSMVSLGRYAYRDGKRTPDGLARVILAAGGDGDARIIAIGSGENLRVPMVPLTPPVTVELQAANGECWGATYSSPIVNDTTEFEARAD